MKDQSAVVTAGAQGIGLAISEALLARGMHVVLLDVDADAGTEAAARLGPRAHFIEGDAADPAAIAHVVQRAASVGRGLRAAVANAGIMISKPLRDLRLDDWNRVLSVNLTSAFLLAQAAAEQMVDGGAIVTIASTRALQSEPHTEAYAASKGGLVALTHALAVSLGPRIRVNCVSPGWIDTAAWQRTDRRHPPSHSDADRMQHPSGRVGRPEDVAAVVAFLLSEEAGFITGQHSIVDGGMTRKMIYV